MLTPIIFILTVALLALPTMCQQCALKCVVDYSTAVYPSHCTEPDDWDCACNSEEFRTSVESCLDRACAAAWGKGWGNDAYNIATVQLCKWGVFGEDSEFEKGETTGAPHHVVTNPPHSTPSQSETEWLITTGSNVSSSSETMPLTSSAALTPLQASQTTNPTIPPPPPSTPSLPPVSSPIPPPPVSSVSLSLLPPPSPSDSSSPSAKPDNTIVLSTISDGSKDPPRPTPTSGSTANSTNRSSRVLSSERYSNSNTTTSQHASTSPRVGVQNNTGTTMKIGAAWTFLALGPLIWAFLTFGVFIHWVL